MNSKGKSKKLKKDNFFHYFVKITGAIPGLIWVRPKIVYKTGHNHKAYKKGFLAISNHVGVEDPVLMSYAFWYRRLYFIAFKELFEKKFNRMFFTHMGVIPIDRENVSTVTIKKGLEVLRADSPLVIFPEGKIEVQGKENAFKSGAVLMAYLSGKPIVPVHIIRAKKWYNRNVVVVGEPIDVISLCGQHPTQSAMAKGAEILQEKSHELVEYYESKRRKK